MDSTYVKMFVGFAALVFGLVHLYKRTKSPETFGKLLAFKKQWGERNGDLFHLFAYVVMPIFLGSLLIVKGFLMTS